MDAENFRKGREEVERMIGSIEEEITAKFVLKSDKKIQEAQQIVNELEKDSSGEVQDRSVYNMSAKINTLKGKIEKLPVRKKPVQKRATKK